MNIATNDNYSLHLLNQKRMEIRQYIELYQYPAASLFQSIFCMVIFNSVLKIED